MALLPLHLLVPVAIDWHAMFVPKVSLLELVLRGTMVYLLILVVMRVFRREAGALNMADLLVVVLVADAAQNAMSSDYGSVTEGAVLVGTIFGWDLLLDWLGFHSTFVRRLMHAEPLALVVHGRIQRQHLRQALVTVDELMEQLREQGVDDIHQVKRCCLEADGHFSVIKTVPGDATTKRGVPGAG